jgi:hypothetical protein
MSEVAAPFHSANSALVAVVIISLGAIIKEVAHGAKIGGELNATIKARVRHGLSFAALGAHHLFDRMPVHFMALGIIVAMTTHISFVTTWCDNAASAHVMLAPNDVFCFFIFKVVHDQ